MLVARELACARGERTLFAGLNFQVNAGELLHVCGENGVGKTSLLRLLAGLSKPVTGDVLWAGQSIKACRETFLGQLLFLGHHSALKGELSAAENLGFSAAIDGITLDEQAARAALEQTGLRGRENFPVEWLSAGQKRRVLLARLLLRNAKLWILDEPFNALDIHATDLLLEMIRVHLVGQGMVVMTSHQAFDIPNAKVLAL